MTLPNNVEGLSALLANEGFVAPAEEAEELLGLAAGDEAHLERIVGRRLTGEPLAWILGTVEFCGLQIGVDSGVYVPRWQSEPLARRAAELLPADGVAVDLCTGAGAIAKTMMNEHPQARVMGSDINEHAVACAQANGVDAYRGDLFSPLPPSIRGFVDVVVGVVPYVPTSSLSLLPRHTLEFESPLSYDGGSDGTQILRRALAESAKFLRSGGKLLLELGGEQANLLSDDLNKLGYLDVSALDDEDGDVRGIELTFDPTWAASSA